MLAVLLAAGAVSGGAVVAGASAVEPAHGDAPGGVASTAVQVTIADAVEVRLDAGGDVVAARTNSRRAPLPGDSLSVEIDGEPAPASDAVRDATFAIAWTGDWSTPGVWHELRP
jgi:hypothetical protein